MSYKGMKVDEKEIARRMRNQSANLFTALVIHLRKQILAGDPSDVVVKEARQLVKDFAHLLPSPEQIEWGPKIDKVLAETKVHPFPVEKQA